MPSPYSVDQYLTELRAIRNTGAATQETSFYPPLSNLLNAVGATLKPKVIFSTQFRNDGAGSPARPASAPSSTTSPSSAT